MDPYSYIYLSIYWSEKVSTHNIEAGGSTATAGFPGNPSGEAQAQAS